MRRSTRALIAAAVASMASAPARGAGLPEQDRARDHSARGRRRRRHLHPRHERGIAEAARADLHRREPHRRRASTSAPAPARKRAPDGYTICVLSSEPIVYSQFLFKSLPFNPEKDFEPITNLFFNTLAFAVNNSLKVKTVSELMALAKKQPGKLSYSTFSFPLVHYMDGLNKKYGVDIVRVPYRSGNEVMTALLSGATPITLLGLSNMVSTLQAGKITALAVNSNSRSPLFPDVPTLKEATGENYPQSWFGLFAPAGTPKPIIAKLHKEVVAITGDPAFHPENVYRARGRAGGRHAGELRALHPSRTARSRGAS